MDIIKSYRKNVVENKAFVFISIALSVLMRLCFYLIYNQHPVNRKITGYLWRPEFYEHFSNKILSLFLGIIFTLITVLYISHINLKYKLIRERTYLIYVFFALFISCCPSFTYMGPQYISLLLMLVSLDSLFDSYQMINASGRAYAVGFMLALSSLFSFHSLMYLPIFWLGFRYMRCLNLKTLCASLLGIFTIYWISFFYFMLCGSVSLFLEPFLNVYPIFDISISQIDFGQVAVFVSCGLLLTIMAVNYWSTAYLDKIQVRASLFFIFTISIYSYLGLLLICYDPILNLLVLIGGGSLLATHFFSLTDQKWKVHLFYILMILYIIISIYFLYSKLITFIL